MSKEEKAARPILTLNSFKKKEAIKGFLDKKIATTLPNKPERIAEQQAQQSAANATANTAKPVRQNNLSKSKASSNTSSSASTKKAVNDTNKKPERPDTTPTTPNELERQKAIEQQNKDFQLIWQYMQKYYPKCFPASQPYAPLAVGIHYQLLAIADMPFSKMQVRRFLKRYVRYKDYRECLIVGTDRVGLDGKPTSKVLEEEMNSAKWQEIKQAKLAAEQQKLASGTNNDIVAK